ncbi:MAG: 2-C-methyl-D-erythritol 4-phosphate cytidylyltransferase [Planctomycetota bacterium]
MECVALVPAAGMGTRMGARKAYLSHQGKPLLGLTLEVLARVPEITRVVVALQEKDLDLWNAAPLWPKGDPRPCKVVKGGATRAHSVMAAFQAAVSDVSAEFLVVIHDAARPFANGKQISEIISHAKEGVAAASAMDVVDTIKEVMGDGNIRTLERARLKAVQTPQVIHSRDFHRGLEQWVSSGFPPITDDLQLVEGCGVRVVLLPGDPQNIKVTYPQDLRVKNTRE